MKIECSGIELQINADKDDHESTKLRNHEKCEERSDLERQFDELSERVIGAAIDVHKTLGPGFLESIYENALRVALTNLDIKHDSQVDVDVIFQRVLVGRHRLDLLIERQLIIELKAVKELEDIHFAQLRSYLRATGLRVGLLFNFNNSVLTIKRVVNGKL